MSGNPWERAHSLTLTTRCCSGWRTRPCKHNYQYNCNRVQLYQLVSLQFISWLVCIWHVGNTCLPMGSGLVTVVLKNPSHSRRPYRPAQWLWRLPVWGRHQGISVLNCLSAGSHGFPSAMRQQVRISIIWKNKNFHLVLNWEEPTLSTGTHSSQGTGATAPILFVGVCVAKLFCGGAITQPDLNIGQMPPVRARSQRNLAHTGRHQGAHVLQHKTNYLKPLHLYKAKFLIFTRLIL